MYVHVEHSDYQKFSGQIGQSDWGKYRLSEIVLLDICVGWDQVTVDTTERFAGPTPK